MTAASESRKRILLFAEAVTLAHVARPICFARGLDRSRYTVAIAAAPWAAPHVTAEGLEHLHLDSIEPSAFLAALSKGTRLYDVPTLHRYVQNDAELIETFRPDLIVGDFRLSLSVSARRARVPYLSISSAYWSPHYTSQRWTVPVLPLTRRLPLGLAQMLFSAARPLAFASHCGPLNALRRRYGMPGLPRDLRRVYTDADEVAYSDLPELFPIYPLPPAHRFLGPVLWEPSVPRPNWWDAVPGDRPQIYLTMGSSGDAALLPRIVRALSSLRVSLVVASAGPMLDGGLPENVHVADYLPGIELAQRCRLVICNGGNLTTYQAIAGGAMVLGIAGNLDQFLNMQAVERAGIGRMLRADRLNVLRLRDAVEEMIGDSRMHDAVRGWRSRVSAWRFEHAAARAVSELIG